MSFYNFFVSTHTIRKVKFLSKNSILTKTQHFHEFFTNFSRQIKVVNSKQSKPQHFHEFFTKKKSTIFSGNQSWIFGQKMKISNSVTDSFKVGIWIFAPKSLEWPFCSFYPILGNIIQLNDALFKFILLKQKSTLQYFFQHHHFWSFIDGVVGHYPHLQYVSAKHSRKL